MKRFNWKLANVTLLKTFLATFVTPFAGAQVVFNPELLQSVYVGLFSSAIMTIIVLTQILDRYNKFLEENHS